MSTEDAPASVCVCSVMEYSNVNLGHTFPLLQFLIITEPIININLDHAFPVIHITGYHRTNLGSHIFTNTHCLCCANKQDI